MLRRSMWRPALLLGVFCIQLAVYGEDTNVPLRFDFGGGQHNFSDTEPSEFTDGVQMWYQGVLLHGDKLRYALTRNAAGARILQELRIDPGANGPSADHVLLDSSQSTMPRVGFRGVLTPTAIIMTKTEATADDTVIRYVVALPGLGDFTGDLRTKHGWETYAGHADHAELIVIGNTTGDKLNNLRFETIYLFGREEQDGQPRDKASITRMKQDLKNVSESKALGGAPAMDFRLESMTLTLEFDKMGNFERFRYGSDGTMQGVPAFDMPVKQHSRAELTPEQ